MTSEEFDSELECMEKLLERVEKTLDAEFVELPNEVMTLEQFDKWLAED